MNRKVIGTLMCVLMVLSMASMAAAFGDGNARKGKFLYRKHCRSCHGATASDLSPSTKTQAEWTAMFSDTSKIPCSSDWSKVKEKDINDIFTYLHDYAKDSPSPAKCS
ncbi:c-type cytochrome [Maridesulfovibrio salexigens]|uniref:Cytochrome c family protein n=1 Tax=Maridesulfovibrio salexigens (strain ATCC 14822 / DSM 2638 / NCIMB 8403 / VKM B-1763) TaxID=526222 RepID=C6BWV7_MARSD|nr:cytochrome c [Maridesulfovibrio salexigens]ACS78437.1 cytochrome c family protein [Maridesulfovibrio salexigens DSM 2638]